MQAVRILNTVNILSLSGTQLYPGYINDISRVDKRIIVKDGVKGLLLELISNGKSGQYVDRIARQAQICQGSNEDFDSLLKKA